MRLKTLELDHFLCFRHLKLDFHPGITAIVGPNGSGKSSALEGIYTALTGETLTKTLDAKVSQFLPAGGKSSAQLVFDHHDVEYTLTRGIKPGSHRLVYANAEGIQRMARAGEIRQHLERIVGHPLETFSRFAFAPQGKIFQLFSQSATARTAAFQSLLALDTVEAVHTALKARVAINKVRDEPSRVEMDEEGKKLTEVAAQRDALKAEITAQEEKLPTLETIQKWRSQIASQNRLTQLTSEQARLEREIAGLDRQLKPAKDLVAASEQQYRESGEKTKAAAEAARRAKQAKENRAKIKQLRAKIEELQGMEKAQQEILDQPLPEDISQERLDQLIADEAVAGAELAAARESLRTLGTGSEICPTCKRPWEEGAVLESHREELEDKIELLQEKHAALKITKRDAVQTRQVFTQASALRAPVHKTIATLSGARVAAIDQLHQIGKITSTVEEDDAAIAAEAAVSEADRRILTRLHGVRQEYDRWLGEHAALSRSLEGVRAQIQESASTETPDAAPEELLAKIEEAEKSRRDLSQQKIELEKLRSQFEIISARYTAVRARYQTEMPEYRWHQRSKRLRDLFAKFPSWALLHLLEKRVVPSVNSRLADFGSAFQVAVDEKEVSLRALFPDGRNVEADVLSGGQKTILAVLTRIAVLRRLARDLGILLLDEPTDALDAENIELFGGFLDRLKATVHQQGLQIVLVTHARRIAEACDSVIELHKLAE